MCDFIRTPYTTRVRPWADSEETREIRWYRALPDAPTLPFPTVFNSLQWQPFPLQKTSPGEVPGEDPISYGGTTPRGATGEHICGTPADFMGEALIEDAHIVPYNPVGLPVCCVGWDMGIGVGVYQDYTREIMPIGPGTDCASALQCTLDVEQRWTLTNDTEQHWFYVDIPTPLTYSIVGDETGFHNVFVTLYPDGTTCGGLGSPVVQWLQYTNFLYRGGRWYFYLFLGAGKPPTEYWFTVRIF